MINDNKYMVGDVVLAKADPSVRLVVRRYVDRIYYCLFKDNPERKEVVYFERELIRELQ